MRLQAKYRTKLNFITAGLAGADRALRLLRKRLADWANDAATIHGQDAEASDLEARFRAALADDLDVPAAMALVSELVRTDIAPGAKASLLRSWDMVVGLDLDRPPARTLLPVGASHLLEARE